VNLNISEIPVVSIDCVVCGKKDIKTVTCPRCETELTIFRAITEGASVLSAQAEKALANMESKKAYELALKSWGLKKNSRAAEIAFLACCTSGEFGEALAWYYRRRDLEI
jgi:hypothetical protein